MILLLLFVSRRNSEGHFHAFFSNLFLPYLFFFLLSSLFSTFFIFAAQRLSLDHATVLSLLSSRGSANCATYSSVHHSSGTISVRSLLLFYSQILGDYDTLVAEYVSEGNYRAAIGSLSRIILNIQCLLCLLFPFFLHLVFLGLSILSSILSCFHILLFLAVLGDAAAGSVGRVESLIYKHAPLLLEKSPEVIVLS